MTYFLDTRPHSVGFFKDENVYIKETFISNNYKYLWLSGGTSNWRDHDDKFSLICFLENKIQGIYLMTGLRRDIHDDEALASITKISCMQIKVGFFLKSKLK